MEGRFGDIVLTARYFYVTALVHLTKDFDDLIYSVSFLFHVSGRVLARKSLIFNGPVCGGQVSIYYPNFIHMLQCSMFAYKVVTVTKIMTAISAERAVTGALVTRYT